MYYPIEAPNKEYLKIEAFLLAILMSADEFLFTMSGRGGDEQMNGSAWL
jgi:hypothetical protein